MPISPAALTFGKPPARIFNGIRLTRDGTSWWTEDRRYEISYGNAGTTHCLQDHPVRLSRETITHARLNPDSLWAQPILTAADAGQKGYLCPAPSEHPILSWQVWDHTLQDYAYDLRDEDRFTTTARALTAALTAQTKEA